MKKSIMIVEDDPVVLLGLESSLEELGYEIMTASDGIIGLHEAKKKMPDLLILDVMLPNKSGLEVCNEIRQSGINFPILLLTSKSDEFDKVKGFDCGADDYVTKPFSLLELHSRIKALLKRSSLGNESPIINPIIDIYENGNVYIDFKKLVFRKSGKAITLSVKEFQIIKFFIQHSGEVVSREMLLDNIWGYETYPTTRTVDNYILNIRKAIEDDPSKPKHIQTIHTVGYKFNC